MFRSKQNVHSLNKSNSNLKLIKLEDKADNYVGSPIKWFRMNHTRVMSLLIKMVQSQH